MSDKFEENPGRYYDDSSIKYRGYHFHRDRGAIYTAQTLHLPKHASLLSVFYSKHIEYDENLIVFYTDDDKGTIKTVMRIKLDNPFEICEFNPVWIEQLTKWNGYLPNIFDSPYGRFYRCQQRKQYAEHGFNRLVHSVFQFAKAGAPPAKDNQVFIVEFHNGDVELGYGVLSKGLGVVVAPSLDKILPITWGDVYFRSFFKGWIINENIPIPWNEEEEKFIAELPKIHLHEPVKENFWGWFNRIFLWRKA